MYKTNILELKAFPIQKHTLKCLRTAPFPMQCTQQLLEHEDVLKAVQVDSTATAACCQRLMDNFGRLRTFLVHVHAGWDAGWLFPEMCLKMRCKCH